MGKVLSIITKPIRDFNIESRAHAAISKSKPIPAPLYKKEMQNSERMMKEYPEVFEESLKKHENLDKLLKNVYVLSQEPKVKDNVLPAANPDRPLPVSRAAAEDFEYGFHEPKRVPYGKVTLRKVLRFLSENHVDPKVYNSTKIAEEYSLPEKTVKNILKYFRVYEIYIPQDRKVKASFAGPAVPRRLVYIDKQKQLPPGKEKNNMYND